jgi:hypothetical protein
MHGRGRIAATRSGTGFSTRSGSQGEERAMKEPVDHILRPQLPWRAMADGAVTECGYDATKVKTLTRVEFFDRLKQFGQQRTALLTCMTCSDTARRWGTWDDDPRLALHREIEWERGGYYYRERTDRGQRLRDELSAIERLINSHRGEFDEAVKEIEERRAWNDRKAALAARAEPRSKSHGL